MLSSLLILSVLSFGAAYPLYAYFFLRDNSKFTISCVFVQVIQTLTLALFVFFYRGLDIVGTTYILSGIIAGIIFLVIYLKEQNLNKESFLFFGFYSCICYYFIHHFLLGHSVLLLIAGYLIGIVTSIIFSFFLKSKQIS